MNKWTLQKPTNFGKRLADAFERDLIEGILGEQLTAADIMHVLSTGLAVLFFGTNVNESDDQDFYIHEIKLHAEKVMMRLEAELRESKKQTE